MLRHHNGKKIGDCFSNAAKSNLSRLVFYFPMVGLINLFLYVLKQPSLASATPDVATLDIAVGHFGHLAVLSSSELNYPFAREVASIAYATVKNYDNHKRAGTGFTRSTTPTHQNTRPLEFDAAEVDFIDEVCVWSSLFYDSMPILI